METYNISLQRIRQHEGPALRLLELLAFLNCKNQPNDFRRFLNLTRPWLGDLQASLPDYDIFAADIADLGEYLAELENVSLGVRPHITSLLQIHPLWLECIRQRAEHRGRVRWLQHILLLCYVLWCEKENKGFDILLPFVDNALAVAAKFRISLKDMTDSEAMLNWIMMIHHNRPQEIESHENTKSPSFLEADNLQAPSLRQTGLEGDTDSQYRVRTSMAGLQEDCE